MLNFKLRNPTKIIFGQGQIAELANLIPKNQRILLIYNHNSIKNNEIYVQVKTALQDYIVFEFKDIEPNPKFEQLLTAIPIIKENKIDFLLAVGGGSTIDGTKFIAAAANFTGDPWEIVKNDPSPIDSALPLGCILTLPATGSEMNCGFVVSKKNSPAKLGSGHELLYPQFSILDPATTYSLPITQTINGIVDTFVHVTEQYLTYPVNTPLQDRFAEGILLTLIEEGPKVLREPNNYEVRANLMWCATCALNDYLGCGVPVDWSTHLLGHELTARFGLDHAVTLAIILPNLLDYKREAKREKLLQYAQRVWRITSGTADEKITKAIHKTREFFESLGMKTHLKDYGINENDVSLLIDQLKNHNLTALGEKRDIDLKQSEEIYLKSI